MSVRGKSIVGGFQFRIISLALLSVLTLHLSLNTAHAQTSPTPGIASQQYITPASNTYPPQSPQYMNILVVNLAHTVSCLGEGYSLIGQPCIELTPTSHGLIPYETNYSSGGVLGFIGGTLTYSLSTPPIKTSEYLSDLTSRFIILKPAYAQVSGSGNSVIKPVERIWQLVRNLAYLGITIVFIVLGFMIMFRRRLNPQTVINIQNAIPGLVIGLIMITFSYFFSALIVDSAFLFTNVIVQTLAFGGLVQLDKGQALISSGNIISVYSKFITWDGAPSLVSGTAGVMGFLREGLIGWITTGLMAFAGCKLGALVGPLVPAVAGAPLGPAGIFSGLFFGELSSAGGKLIGCGVGGVAAGIFAKNTNLVPFVAAFILYLILILALLIAMFRVLFIVIQTYVSIILLTITAPLRFLLASVPGTKASITNWFKEMFAHALIFPALFAGFFLVAYILGNGHQLGTTFGIINGPNDSDFAGGAVPFMGGLDSIVLRGMLGYGLLLFIPNIPDVIKGALGVKDPGYGKAVIGAVTGGFGLGRNFLNRTFAVPLQERKAVQEARLKAEAQKWANPGTKPPRTRPWLNV